MGRIIQGRVQMMLGFWTDPAWRRRGLARRACHLAMLSGVSEWQPDYTIGFVDDSSSQRLTWRDRERNQEGYGWRHREPEVEIHCPSIGSIVEDLVAMTRAQLEHDIIRYRPSAPASARALWGPRPTRAGEGFGEPDPSLNFELAFARLFPLMFTSWSSGAMPLLIERQR